MVLLLRLLSQNPAPSFSTASCAILRLFFLRTVFCDLFFFLVFRVQAESTSKLISCRRWVGGTVGLILQGLCWPSPFPPPTHTEEDAYGSSYLRRTCTFSTYRSSSVSAFQPPLSLCRSLISCSWSMCLGPITCIVRFAVLLSFRGPKDEVKSKNLRSDVTVRCGGVSIDWYHDRLFKQFTAHNVQLHTSQLFFCVGYRLNCSK